MNNLLDNFATNCFSEKNLKNRVPDYVFIDGIAFYKAL